MKLFHLFISCLVAAPKIAHGAFISDRGAWGVTTAPKSVKLLSTVEAPTRERTDTGTKRGRQTEDDISEDDIRRKGPLEYLEDPMESREMDDPFHILLMGSTFEKPKITVTYVSGSLEYVLSMPFPEAKELSAFAAEHGMSCLGTWSREECLELGKQLQVRDIVCRVVPFCEGGQRGWQARDASGADSNIARNW